MGPSTAAILMDGTTGSGLAAGNGPDKTFGGGHCSFLVESTFGGGSVKLQMKLHGGTYFDVPSATLSAAGYTNQFLPPGTYRAVSTTATATTARLVNIPT